MRLGRVTLLISLLLVVAGTARATAPTCAFPVRVGPCTGEKAGPRGTADVGKGTCTGAPTDCGPELPYSG
jgi:hypothetical protein